MALIHERMNRGHTQQGWLDSRHTFSFGDFNDPTRMGFHALRVINEDRVIPGAGFGKHDHSDMDILTYVISGALRHEDSLGNGSVIQAGDVQLMSAGSGVSHSEMNASDTEPVHFLQIWLIPDSTGGTPTYQQVTLDKGSFLNRPGQLAGPKSSLISLISDTKIYLARLEEGHTISQDFVAGRAGFLQIIQGRVSIEGETLSAGDGMQFSGVDLCTITATTDCELLVFDLA